jgi:hypothetical protein
MARKNLSKPRPGERQQKSRSLKRRSKLRRAQQDALPRLKHREAQRRYQQSPKGRDTQRRYRLSPFGVEAQHRYRISPKGREAQWRYRRSFKGWHTRYQYDRTPARVAYKREWAQRYRKTALYKERQLDRHYRRADALFRDLSSPRSYYPAYAEDLARYHRLLDFLTKREQEQIEREQQVMDERPSRSR